MKVCIEGDYKPIISLIYMFNTLNEMMWTAGIQMKWVCDYRSESQFKKLRKSPENKGFRGCDGHILISCSTQARKCLALSTQNSNPKFDMLRLEKMFMAPTLLSPHS